MHAAIFWDNTESLKSAIASSTAIDKVNNYGFTALEYAVLFGDVQATKWLLEAGADPDGKGGLRESPLLTAMTGKKVQLIVPLIKHGANLQALDQEGYSVIHVAARPGIPYIIREAAKRGIDLNRENRRTTPMGMALRHSKLSSVIELALQGVPVDKIPRNVGTLEIQRFIKLCTKLQDPKLAAVWMSERSPLLMRSFGKANDLPVPLPAESGKPYDFSDRLPEPVSERKSVPHPPAKNQGAP